MQQNTKRLPRTPAVLKTVMELRNFVDKERSTGKSMALIPTMGALHDGHMALVESGLQKANTVLVSIFVNPIQFGPGEDLNAYPCTWDSDLKKLEAAGAHAVYAPTPTAMYPDGFASAVTLSGVSEPLEGTFRPTHFSGVATVVTKLLLQARPDIALFGEKDYQQLQVIKRFTADLDIPVEIIGVPIVRDKNGLALSSRNAYLDDRQYETAIRLNKTLFAMAGRIAANEDIKSTQQWGRQELEKAGFEKIDYLEICDVETLQPVTKKTDTKNPLRILTAVHLDRVRLIDNIGV